MEERKEKIIRPKFHVTGGEGWINDPNGLIFYKGRYHAFYQHYPHDVHWGPMHWGHVVSDDLVHWQYLPIALYPGDKGDENGCFSGSAIVWQDKLWLLYTGFAENGGGENVRQLQCLASSTDGVHFEKHGVVIGEKDLPKEYAPWDFRDPKVWRENDAFWCVVAARIRGGRGRILLYRSEDLFSWQFVSDLFEKDCPGEMIECPDYCSKQNLLVYCEQLQPAEGKMHLNIHTSRWKTGTLDLATGKFAAENSGIVDYGFDFYAPQSFAGDDVLIGWLNMWDRNVPSEKYGFAGMLTAPRKLLVKDGRLHQEPVVNCSTAYKATGSHKIEDRVVKGVITVKAKNLESFAIKMRTNGTHYTQMTLQDSKWVFDRSKSGEVINGAEKDLDSVNGIRRMPCSNE
jgi:beta-fructofuranosidase